MRIEENLKNQQWDKVMTSNAISASMYQNELNRRRT